MEGMLGMRSLYELTLHNDSTVSPRSAYLHKHGVNKVRRCEQGQRVLIGRLKTRCERCSRVPHTRTPLAQNVYVGMNKGAACLCFDRRAVIGVF